MQRTPSLSPVAVLIVDDDDGTRAVLSDIMRDQGYTVYQAPDGISALERLRAHASPLVVLMDWWMPGLDGLSVLRALAVDMAIVQPHVFILLSAAKDDLGVRLSHDPTAIPTHLPVTVLGKPFDLDDIVTLVARAAAHLDKARDESSTAARELSESQRI